jgi:DNA invertase Pin-like site-specific DNA recombinase
MPSGREIGAEKRNAILRYALAGLKRAEVARRLGISFEAVNRYWPVQEKKNNAPKRSSK